MTSNPTIFAQAIAGTAAYDAQLATLQHQHISAAAALEALATQDVRDACDLFRPLYEGTDGGDGFVSIESRRRLPTIQTRPGSRCAGSGRRSPGRT